MSDARNIIVEDGFDFWKELNEDEETDDFQNKIINKKLCELTREPLVENYITLPCGHSFNYKPLCIELCTLKDPNNVKSMTRYLGRRICCPYCRQTFNKLLPVIPTIKIEYKCSTILPKYVATTSQSNMIEHRTCSYVYKSGKNKGKQCGCKGFDVNGVSLCIKHWRASQRAKKQIIKKKLTVEELSNIGKEIYGKMKVVEMKVKLKEYKQKVSGTKAELADRLSKLNI